MVTMVVHEATASCFSVLSFFGAESFAVADWKTPWMSCAHERASAMTVSDAVQKPSFSFGTTSPILNHDTFCAVLDTSLFLTMSAKQRRVCTVNVPSLSPHQHKHHEAGA